MIGTLERNNNPGRSIETELLEWAKDANIFVFFVHFQQRESSKEPCQLDKNTHSTMSICLYSSWHGLSCTERTWQQG